MSDPNYLPAILLVVITLVGWAGIWLLQSGRVKLPVMTEAPAEPKYVLVECDCGAEMPCPNGRDVAKNPVRCKVNKIVHEGVITRARGVLE